MQEDGFHNVFVLRGKYSLNFSVMLIGIQVL